MWLANHRRRETDQVFVDLLAERDQLTKQVDHLTRERDLARADLATVRHNADERAKNAEAARREEHDRNTRLRWELREARREYDATDYGQLEARLKRALRGCARARRDLADLTARKHLARDLELANRARRSLEQQIAGLQTANEKHYAAMHDLATADQPREHQEVTQ